MRKVFLDTETTGLSPGMIAQLALIVEENNEIVKVKNYFFTIDYITKSAQETCSNRGIEFYKEASNGKRFADYAEEILQELTGATLVGHNISFDENFLSTEFWRLNIMFRPESRIDTMKYFKDKVNAVNSLGRTKYPNLSEVINYCGISNNEIVETSKRLFRNIIDTDNLSAHDAIYDTVAMYLAYKKSEGQ